MFAVNERDLIVEEAIVKRTAEFAWHIDRADQLARLVAQLIKDVHDSDAAAARNHLSALPISRGRNRQ